MHNKKIAILGNMNNNGFALMRYFRSLGFDAHLFLFANDGKNTQAHFAPEADTYCIEKWQPYIHTTIILNSPDVVFNRFVYTVKQGKLFLAGLIKGIKTDYTFQYPGKAYLKTLFSSYNYIVGSGIAPAVLDKAGLRLDIFFPYSTGVEFVHNVSLPPKAATKALYNIYANYVRSRQVAAIQKARYCFNAELSITQAVLDRYKIKTQIMAVPMVYIEDCLADTTDTYLADFFKKLSDYEFIVFNCSRQIWIKPDSWHKSSAWHESKHNDWLVNGFNQLTNEKPNIKCLLVLVEYGPDVSATKRLVKELGISDKVYWLKKLSRKQILQILLKVQVGVSEFRTLDEMIWGGSGWEILASGKPMMQTFRFNEGVFEEKFGYPPPPILKVYTASDVYVHLLEMATNSYLRENIGKQAKNWFKTYNGQNLAAQWLQKLLN